VLDRHFFVLRRDDDLATHHLSLTQNDSAFWSRQLAFRDALRADAVLRREYEALKLKLAAAFPEDRIAYLEGKTEFVCQVLRPQGLV